MNKAELIKKVADESKVPVKETEKIINELIFEIKESLSNGKKVILPNFGTFTLVQRAPKIFKNPRNGQETKLPARTLPYFKASAKLKAKLQD